MSWLRCVCSAVGVLAAVACHGVSPGAAMIEGPLPTTVLILPPNGGGAYRDAALGLMVACEESLRARGYVPVPIEVGLAILDARGYSLEVPVPSEGPGGAALPAAVDGLGVDACLAIDLRAWDTYWNAGLEAVDYDVRFRLLDAQRGQPLFEREYGASWSWAGRLRTTGSGRPALGDEFEGFTGTGEVPESPYKNAFQFVRQIARRFAASLPARSG